MYRQGDILLKPVKAAAEGVEAKKAVKSLLVAEGEATGHHHTLYAEKGATITEYTQADVDARFVEIMAANGMAGAKLQHQEHATITIPPGIYEVKRQKEYAPERSRYVAD